MRAFVDEDTCIGCGLCEGTCPEVFTIGDDGKSHAISTEIPSDVEETAKEAEENCPVSAITLED